MSLTRLSKCLSKCKSVLPAADILLLSVPDKETVHILRQGDLRLQFLAFHLVMDRDFTRRMRHGAADFLEFAQVWFDADPLESDGVGVDAQDRAEELDVRAGAPGMAVGPGAEHVGVLAPGRHAHGDVFPPGAQPVQIIVPEAGLHIGLVQVELVVDGAPAGKSTINSPSRKAARPLSASPVVSTRNCPQGSILFDRKNQPSRCSFQPKRAAICSNRTLSPAGMDIV